MKKSLCRYTNKQLISLGYQPKQDDSIAEPLDPRNGDMVVVAAGGFDNIMKVVFETEDGSLPNLLKVSINENTPDSVRQFVNNVLSVNITAFKAAPDDDTAFDMICPRGASYEQYADMIRESLSRYKSEYDAKQNNP